MRKCATALGLFALLASAGCSGRTTGAIDINGQTARLTAVGSCDQSCTAFMRWRQVGQSAWTNAPTFNVGRAVNAPWGQVATGLTGEAAYEYQACGKENTSSSFVCVGPDGTPNTTQKFVARVGSGDWAQFHYDSALTGHNPFEITLNTGNANALTRAWTANFPGSGAVVGSPAVVNGVVYATVSTGQGSSYLEAFPAFCATGGASCDPLWRGPVVAPAASAAPAVAGGVVYVGGDRLYAFDASGCGRSTCPPVWTGTTGGNIVSSPTVFGNVYVGTGGSDNRIYGFRATGCGMATCSPSWSQRTFGAVSTPAATSAGRVSALVLGAEQHVYEYFEGDGLVWTTPTGGTVTAPVSSGNAMLEIGSADGKLYALDVPEGKVRWTATTGGPIRSAPAFVPNVNYVGSDDGKLYAFPVPCPMICGPMWTAATGGAIRSAPAVANGVVYVGSSDGKLYEFATDGCGSATCAPLASQRPANRIDPNTSPAVAGGAVYFAARGTPSTAGGASLQAYSLP